MGGFFINKQINNYMKQNSKNATIHVRVDEDTRNKWLEVCDAMNGSTQSKVFRHVIKRLHSSIDEMTSIKELKANEINIKASVHLA